MALDAVSISPRRAIPGIDQLLVAASTPDCFVAALLDMLMTIEGVDAAWVGRPDSDGLLRPQAVRAPDMAVLKDPAAMVNVQDGPRSRSPAGRAWRTGIAQCSSDIDQDESLIPWRADWKPLGFRVSAAIPLIGVGGVHRILTMYSRAPDFFETRWPMKLLTEFGMVIGTAIESRQTEQALQRAKRLLDTLFIGTEILLDAVNETKVLRTICKRLSETGLFISAAIGRVDAAGMFGYPIAAGRDAAAVRRLRQNFSETGPQQMLGARAMRKGAVIVDEHYGAARRQEPWRSIAMRSGWQSAAAAPIRRAGAVFAVLFLVSGDSSVIDTETQRLITQLAGNIGRALDELDLKAALRAEREAQSRIARHDKLTGLPNRLAFEEALPLALAHAARHGSVSGIGILDLDNFKPVNDGFGHAVGDSVLRVLAQRIRAALRDVDFVARLGGDEFALIIDNLDSTAQISGFCSRLDELIRRPIRLEGGTELVISASLGFTLFPTDQEPPDTLIRHADMALYAAKAAKSTRARNWTTYQEMVGASPAQAHHHALLSQDQVEVHYQPMISLARRSVIAIEALARLRDGDRLIAPADFLPDLTAQDREALLASVLRQGIACLAAVSVEAPGLMLSVNVDAEVLARGAVPAMIETAIAGTGVAPGQLVIELLESHEFPNSDIALARMNALRACGVAVALDDLGVEFSTLKRIQTLPIDHIKIDRNFLADVMRSPNDLVFLATYISMAEALGLSLCIEGAETADMLDALQILRAPMAQGFGIAHPMPREALANWLRQEAKIPPRGVPRTMLGAYALHILWVRVFLFAPFEASVVNQLRRSGRLSLTPFIIGRGIGDTALGMAYEGLMTLVEASPLDIPAATRQSETVRGLLAAAVIAGDEADSAEDRV